MSMRIERIYSSENEQSNCLNAINDQEATQKDVVSMLADCIIADQQAKRDGGKRVDFQLLGQAVMKRWPKALERINDQAIRKARGL